MAEDNSKSAPGLVVLIIGSLLAGLGIIGPISMRSGNKPTNPASPSTPDKQKNDSEKPNYPKPSTSLDLVSEFFDADPCWRFWGSSSPGAKCLRAQIERRWKKPEVSFVVAAMPDPIDSHLQTDFDIYLTTLQLACEKHGYVLDRYYLPWKYVPRDKSVLSDNDRPYREHPGVMLFRYQPEKPRSGLSKTKLLVVFLVGETPTGGVFKPAFREALEQVANWQLAGQQDAPCEQCVVVQLLGPSSSSAASSLRAGIEAWCHTRRFGRVGRPSVMIDAISGSATVSSVAKTLRTTRRDEQFPGLTIRYQATIISDEISMPLLYDHLIDVQGIQPSQIVVLSESSTSYGAGFRDGRKDKNTQSKRKHRNAPRDCKNQDAGKYDGIQTLYYPLEIGRLRAEYEKDPMLKFGPTQASDNAPRLNLSFPLDEPPYAEDIPPSFSSATPAMLERRLANLFGAIARQDIRAIGIVGTDVRDVIFMTQQVKLHCPDVQLFTFENHLAFTHPDYARFFEGMLVATTYPLLMDTQSWHLKKPPDFSPIQFSSTSSEGMHNAMLALLNRTLPANEQVSLVDYDYPFSAEGSCRRPPLWLVTIGSNGIWPVVAKPIARCNDKHHVMYADSTPVDGQPRIASELLGGFPSVIYAVVAGLICLLSGLVLSAKNEAVRTQWWWTVCGTTLDSWLVPPLQNKAGSEFRWTRITLSSDARKLDVQRTCYAYVYFAAILGLLLLLLIPSISAVLALLSTSSRIALSKMFLTGWTATSVIGVLVLDVCLGRFLSRSQRRITVARGIVALILFTTILAMALPTSRLALDVERAAWLGFIIALLAATNTAVVACNLDQGIRFLDLTANRLRFAVHLIGVTAIVIFAAITANVWYLCLAAVPFMILEAICDWRTLQKPWRSVADGLKLLRPQNVPWHLTAVVVPVLILLQQYHLQTGAAPHSSAQAAIAAKRLGTFSSGVSPLGPLVLAGVIVALWALCSLRRIHQATTHDLLGWVPKHWRNDDYARAMFDSVRKLRSRLKDTNPRDWHVMDAVFAVLAVGVFAYLLFYRWIGSVEGPLYDDIVKLALIVCLLLVGGLFIHAKLVCDALHEVLRQLNNHPFGSEFRRIPEQLKHRVGPHLIARPIRLDEYRQLIELGQAICSRTVPSGNNCLTIQDNLQRRADGMEHAWENALACPTDSSFELRLGRFSRLLLEQLNRQWGDASARKSPSSIKWTRNAERFLAMHITFGIRSVLLQVRSLLTFLMATLLLFVWALNTYPFQPSRIIALFCYGFVIWIVTALAYRFVALNRNGIISAFTGTKAGVFTWDRSLIVPILLYVVLPLLALLAIQFPSVSNVLFQWSTGLQKAVGG